MAERMRGGQSSPLQNFRLDRPLWRRFGRATAKNGTNRTAALRQFVLWYLGDEDTALPVRPNTPTPELPEDREEDE